MIKGIQNYINTHCLEYLIYFKQDAQHRKHCYGNKFKYIYIYKNANNELEYINVKLFDVGTPYIHRMNYIYIYIYVLYILYINIIIDIFIRTAVYTRNLT